MSRYTTKLQNIQEANVRLERRLLNEQQEFPDSPLPGCLKKIIDLFSSIKESKYFFALEGVLNFFIIFFFVLFLKSTIV